MMCYISARLDAIIRKLKAETACSLCWTLACELKMVSKCAAFMVHVYFLSSELRSEKLSVQSQVCDNTAVLPGQMCLRNSTTPPCDEWDGTERHLNSLGFQGCFNLFSQSQKPKRIQPCIHFVHILCYEYGFLLWRVNKIFTVYKSWKIISLSAADLLSLPAPGQIG